MKITHMPNNLHLEPRVAKLEAGLEILTKSVSDLTGTIRDNNSSMEEKIERITVAVTQAQAPRRTDWSVIISAVLLVMAIGSAVFWPLNQTSQDNKVTVSELSKDYSTHVNLDSHSVSAVLLNRLEENFQVLSKDTEERMKLHVDYENRMFTELDKKLQQEYTLITKTTDAQMKNIEDTHTRERKEVFDRIVKLEDSIDQDKREELHELRAWRNKASGLSSPTMAVPLIPKEVPREVSK